MSFVASLLSQAMGDFGRISLIFIGLAGGATLILCLSPLVFFDLFDFLLGELLVLLMRHN